MGGRERERERGGTEREGGKREGGRERATKSDSLSG